MIDGEPTKVKVKTGVSDSERTEIISGLSAGDKIALQSFKSLGDESKSNRQRRGFMGMGGGRRGGPVPH